MQSISASRILCNRDNLAREAAITVSAQRASDDIRLVAQARQGGGRLVLAGPYLGAEDGVVDVEVLSGTTEDGSPSQLQDKDGNTLPEGGCGLIGSKESSGGHPRSEWDVADVLLGEAWDRLLADPGFQAAEADWATCMSKSGYDFQHRWDAANSLTGDDPERSKDMALLDLDCAEETNYIGRAMAIDVAIQNQLISDNEASLRAALDIQKEMLSIAKKALK